MSHRDTRKGKPRKLGVWAWYGYLAAFPVLVLAAVEGMSRGSLGAVWTWCLAQPAAVALTLVSFLAFEVIFTALTGRLWLGVLIPSVVAVGFGIANYCKLVVNGTVLVLSDLVMAAHLPTLMGFLPSEIGVPVGVALGTVAAVILCAVTTQPLPENWRTWRRRGPAAVAALCVLLCALLIPWRWFVGDMMAAQKDRNERLGLAGGLYSGLLSRAAQLEERIDPEEALRVLEELEEDETPYVPPAVRPNVVMLMSESFCDPSVILPEVDFREDPIANFHALAEEYPSGTFYSNTYAGGTGNVEMEVFSGIPMGLLPEGEDLTTISGEDAYDRIPSIVRAFREGGYSTQFVHSYTSSLYQRSENFPKDAQRAGPYLTDTALSQEMIRAFEEKEAGKPLFLYGLSMENHQPITGDKFGESSGLEPTCPQLGEEELGVADALAYALHGADQGLRTLVDYLEDYPEPVILVFWGDHLPGLSTGEGKSTLYSLLGHVPVTEIDQWDAETMKEMHKTVFLVWNNFDASLDVPEEVSAASLGSLVLDWAQVEKPAFFRWVDKAQETVFLYRKGLYIDDQGTPYRQIPEGDRELMERYRKLVFAILYVQGQDRIS